MKNLNNIILKIEELPVQHDYDFLLNKLMSINNIADLDLITDVQMRNLLECWDEWNRLNNIDVNHLFTMAASTSGNVEMFL